MKLSPQGGVTQIELKLYGLEAEEISNKRLAASLDNQTSEAEVAGV